MTGEELKQMVENQQFVRNIQEQLEHGVILWSEALIKLHDRGIVRSQSDAAQYLGLNQFALMLRLAHEAQSTISRLDKIIKGYEKETGIHTSVMEASLLE